MQDFMVHEIAEQQLYLLPERALWWPSERMLIVADVHLGKATHFNKSGLAIPNRRAVRDISFLELLVQELEAERLLILGDLFHSDYNSEFALLQEFCRKIAPVQVELVPGNHDIAGNRMFENAGLRVHTDPYCMEPFCFTHDAEELNKKHHLYILSGHVHPGVRLHGKGRQSISIPCFYFGKEYGLLPAFGSMTGLFRIQAQEPGDQVYGIAGEKIVRVPLVLKNEL